MFPKKIRLISDDAVAVFSKQLISTVKNPVKEPTAEYIWDESVPFKGGKPVTFTLDKIKSLHSTNLLKYED